LQGTEFALRYSDANHPGHPTAGRIGKLDATIFTDVKDNRFGFWKYSLDLTQHFELFYDRVIALRLAGELTEDLDRDIPFYHLAEFGSHETIRGFTRGRFRDKDMLLGSVEYRYPIWIPWEKAVDAVLFFDSGQVAGNVFDDAALRDLQFGYGGGLRFYGARGLLARTEIGVSKEGVRLYVTLNQ
jgi:outer membrane protein assembly factor BamA